MPSDSTPGSAAGEAESRLVTGWRKHLAAWREMDSRRRRFGFGVWLTGAEVHVGIVLCGTFGLGVLIMDLLA